MSPSARPSSAAIGFRFAYLLLVIIRGIIAEDEHSKVAEEQPSKVSVQPWAGEDVNDLHAEYYNIFKHGNRNAASHLWSAFLLDRADQMTHEKFTYMFTGFCAVSGSPVSPRDGNRWRYNLTKVGGGGSVGYLHHCCWPCVCDTQDFIRVDTRTVTLVNGEKRQYRFAVLGNPCDNPEALTKPFIQPFDGRETTIKREAAEVRCDASGNLEGAYLSDHGNIIISMFFDEDPALKSNDEKVVETSCNQRAAAGYNSGMGEIFRKVAAITPVKSVKITLDSKASMKADGKHSAAPMKSAAEPTGADLLEQGFVTWQGSTSPKPKMNANAASSAPRTTLAAVWPIVLVLATLRPVLSLS